MKIKARILRLEETVEGALGVLLLNNRYFCSTLEPDKNDPVRYQIETGIYYCKRYSSEKFPNTFEVIVPGHTALLFHAGNVEEDTTGCIILGQYPGKLRESRAVLNSGATFKLFMSMLEGVDYFYCQFYNMRRRIYGN